MKKDRLEKLKKVPLFEGVKESTLERLAESAVTKKFKAGETIIREGEYGEEMFILTKGTVKITKYITLHKSEEDAPDMEKDLITLHAEDHPYSGDGTSRKRRAQCHRNSSHRSRIAKYQR